MGKVLEGHTMQLMQKWDIGTPRFVIADSLEAFDALTKENEWLEHTRLVIKAHEAIGGRGLLGLVKMGMDLEKTRKAVEEILAYDKGGITINQVIVQENIPHSNKREFYTSIMSRRDGVDLLLSRWGGVNIENRCSMKRTPCSWKSTRSRLRKDGGTLWPWTRSSNSTRSHDSGIPTGISSSFRASDGP
jgi:ATP-citrate lyase beta-subunit